MNTCEKPTRGTRRQSAAPITDDDVVLGVRRLQRDLTQSPCSLPGAPLSPRRRSRRSRLTPSLLYVSSPHPAGLKAPLTRAARFFPTHVAPGMLGVCSSPSMNGAASQPPSRPHGSCGSRPGRSRYGRSRNGRSRYRRSRYGRSCCGRSRYGRSCCGDAVTAPRRRRSW